MIITIIWLSLLSTGKYPALTKIERTLGYSRGRIGRIGARFESGLVSSICTSPM